MKKKLTLRMSEDAIRRAKSYASERGTSVSQLVENFFAALEDDVEDGDRSHSAVVRELTGIAEGGDVSEQDYYDHLADKHR